ncbi:MAG: hypothetical protein GF309_00345 [Candidatus Lokiarchaeota archaeon]|jgi:hypothetical protein|nr:hypothetical protein [Candidatus Lokiarchaeota archaeon]
MGKRIRLALIAMIFVVTGLLPFAAAQPRIATGYGLEIVDAYYADLDGDGVEDDIKILVEFSFGNTNPSRVDLRLTVELPSGTVYSFRVSVYRPPTKSILNIDCFDMATESGWYIVSMVASVMGSGNGKVYITDQMAFDPPTKTGPGLPGVDAYF